MSAQLSAKYALDPPLSWGCNGVSLLEGCGRRARGDRLGLRAPLAQWKSSQELADARECNCSTEMLQHPGSKNKCINTMQQFVPAVDARSRCLNMDVCNPMWKECRQLRSPRHESGSIKTVFTQSNPCSLHSGGSGLDLRSQAVAVAHMLSETVAVSPVLGPLVVHLLHAPFQSGNRGGAVGGNV